MIVGCYDLVLYCRNQQGEYDPTHKTGPQNFMRWGAGFPGVNEAHSKRLARYAVTSTGSNQWRLFEDTPLFAEEVERRRQLMSKKVELNEDWVVQRILIKAAANLGEILRKLEDHDNNLDCLSPDELYVITEFTSETRWEGRGWDADCCFLLWAWSPASECGPG